MNKTKWFIVALVGVTTLGVLLYLIICVSRFEEFASAGRVEDKYYTMFAKETTSKEELELANKASEHLKSCGFEGRVVSKDKAIRKENKENIFLEVSKTPLVVNPKTILIVVPKDQGRSLDSANYVKEKLKEKGIKVNVMQKNMDVFADSGDVYFSIGISKDLALSDSWKLLNELLNASIQLFSLPLH